MKVNFVVINKSIIGVLLLQFHRRKRRSRKQQNYPEKEPKQKPTVLLRSSSPAGTSRPQHLCGTFTPHEVFSHSNMLHVVREPCWGTSTCSVHLFRSPPPPRPAHFYNHLNKMEDVQDLGREQLPQRLLFICWNHLKMFQKSCPKTGGLAANMLTSQSVSEGYRTGKRSSPSYLTVS